jgi:hypothetical protein
MHCDGMSQITVIYEIECLPNSAPKNRLYDADQATTTTKDIILGTAIIFISVIRINVAKFLQPSVKIQLAYLLLLVLH